MKLLARALALLTQPDAAWREIAAEHESPSGLFGHALVLAAIPALATFIGFAFVGLTLGANPVRTPPGWALGRGVLTYVLWLLGVWATALVIDVLAPRFEGRAGLAGALKLTVYAPTAAWLAGIFWLVPSFGILSLLGLYSVYTLAVGLPIVTRCPPDEVPGFAGLIVLCFIVIAAVIVIAGNLLMHGAAP